MLKCRGLYFLLHVTISVVFAGTDSYLWSVNNVEFKGNERFPEVIDVFFGYQGNDIFLQLERDDEATAMLSEDLFAASRILPSDVFKEENNASFAAYQTGGSDVVVVHRESEDAKLKFYGRFTQNNEKMLIQSEEGRPGFHRVRREEHLETERKRRATEPFVIELFVFADLSVFEHVRDQYLPSGTSKEIKIFTRDYIKAITKEVDIIYQKLGEDELGNELRVYFLEYQIITKSSQQKWVTDNLSGGKLKVDALTSFEKYYTSLITKFAFPTPDYLMALTRLEIEGDFQAINSGAICGNSWSIGTSIARIQTYPTSVAQAIAKAFSVPDDSATSCSDADRYIMSSNYAPDTTADKRGNRWLFSSCSISAFKTAFGGGEDLSCLQTQDITFDIDAYDRSQTLSELLTLEEQCVLLYTNGVTACGSVDCYSSANGCLVSSVCEPMYIPQDTLCSTTNANLICRYGFCEPNVTTTTVTTTTSTITTTTTEEGLQTTTATDRTVQPTSVQPTSAPNCVQETGFVEFDLPGCGCCGGCGCDTECGDCLPGLPSQTQAGSCTKDPNCCGSKVRMTTLFVPSGCELTYTNGPKTIVTERKGWEQEDTEVTAEVYQDSNDRWQVMLSPKA